MNLNLLSYFLLLCIYMVVIFVDNCCFILFLFLIMYYNLFTSGMNPMLLFQKPFASILITHSEILSFMAFKYWKLNLCKKVLILADFNWTRTQNHLVRKRTLSHLAKLASTWLQTGYKLWLNSLGKQIDSLSSI